jgi:hypothetical protein
MTDTIWAFCFKQKMQCDKFSLFFGKIELSVICRQF